MKGKECMSSTTAFQISSTEYSITTFCVKLSATKSKVSFCNYQDYTSAVTPNKQVCLIRCVTTGQFTVKCHKARSATVHTFYQRPLRFYKMWLYIVWCQQAIGNYQFATGSAGHLWTTVINELRLLRQMLHSATPRQPHHRLHTETLRISSPKQQEDHRNQCATWPRQLSPD